MRRLYTLGLVLCLSVPVVADILITKDGRIFLGYLDEEKPGDEYVVMRWPYKRIKERGEMRFHLDRQVRWHKRGTDLPDDDYWGEHAQEEIVADPKSQLTEEEMASILTLRVERLAQKIRDDNNGKPPPDSNALAPISVSSTEDLRLVTEPVGWKLWAYQIRPPEGWEVDRHEGIHFWAGPAEADGFRPQIHVLYFRTTPVPNLMGDNGLVSLTLDVTKNFSDHYGRPRISTPEIEDDGETQRCMAEVTVVKGKREIYSRKIFIITGNSAYILASYDLKERVGLRDKVIRQALASFEILR